jgi:hypothetical protein
MPLAEGARSRHGALETVAALGTEIEGAARALRPERVRGERRIPAELRASAGARPGTRRTGRGLCGSSHHRDGAGARAVAAEMMVALRWYCGEDGMGARGADGTAGQSTSVRALPAF